MTSISYSYYYTLFIIFNTLTLTLTLILFSIPITSSNEDNFSENLLETIISTRLMEKTTNLHFYFQDIVSGKNPTSIQIIGQGLGFGATFMIDNALTEKPARDSRILGRAQGMYSSAAQRDTALLMVVVFEFTQGKYNGSSISMLGRNHVFDNVREMPIVGGSGLFRFGRGYALAHTVSFDPKTGDASVEYNVSIKHF